MVPAGEATRARRVRTIRTWAGVVLLLSPTAVVASPRGVVVEAVTAGFSASKAGVAVGDVLVGWDRSPAPPANPEGLSGLLESPFDVATIEFEQGPRGRVGLTGLRSGAPLRVEVDQGEWRLEVRPAFEPDLLARYEDGRRRSDAKDLAGAASIWTDLARALESRGAARAACWLWLRLARAAAGAKAWTQADAAFAEAMHAAESAADHLALAHIGAALGSSLLARAQWDAASDAYRLGMEAARRVASPSLNEARMINNLGVAAWRRRDLDAARQHYAAALEIREALAPGSLEVGNSLNNLGVVADALWDLAAAESYHRRALELRQRVAPMSLEASHSLNNLGVLAKKRGDLATAQDYYRRTLAIKERLVPGSSDLALTLNNLGNLAVLREDWPGARAALERALEIQLEADGPRSQEVAFSLNNLGLLALAQEDLDAAQAYFQESLDIKLELMPDTLEAAASLSNLGRVAERRGNLADARSLLERALALSERLAPGSAAAGNTRVFLGHVSRAAGDWPAAEAHYGAALAVHRAQAPGGSVAEAEACQLLAGAARRRGSQEEALEHYRCALEALEAQRRVFGGSDQLRSRFGAKYADYYRDSLDYLVRLGRTAEAFHTLERYRARAWLALLAERDLVFAADVPAELDRERREVNAEYDRALARLNDAHGDLGEKRAQLARLRERQEQIRGRVRAASPRLGALQYPEPLDLAGARAQLDPGTLMLSYSIGGERSYLFALGPGPDDFRAVPLDVRLADLRRDVGSFRELLERGGRLGQRRLRAQARRLSERLLAPVSREVARAERLLVVPDGPLHLMPFAALADPTRAAFRYLVQAKPAHVVASATVLAELRRAPPSKRPHRLVAFGDPDYSASGQGQADLRAEVHRAVERGMKLRPLPASRREVQDLGRLFPEAARAFLGREATEEQAKRSAPEASLLHFACHGLADEGSPLDSALALSLPGDPVAAGRDNGLLQAWEVFEGLRLDADLVTLSACGTALGQEMSGEGVLGLTRAFQYAGARTVLASLWAVEDAKTSDLMRSFYGHLRRGASKDAALREAQIEALASPASAHPSHWAAFHLVGDWR